GAGSSDGGTWGPSGVLTGTVLGPNGHPVSGALVMIYNSDVPASDPAGWSPAVIGNVTTDANGVWTFTVPAYSALPADAQAAANGNGGWLNMMAFAWAYATVNGTQYQEGADGARSAWVGTSSQPSGPVQVAHPAGAVPAMIESPDQADLSSQDTTTAEQSTWT